MDTLVFGTSRLQAPGPGLLHLVPATLARELAPAAYLVYEWTEYWVEAPGADHLRLGEVHQPPVTGHLFRLRFENRLGLATIRPYAGSRPLGPPLHVEILSRKFPTPDSHVDFFRALLDDLFARAARLPFALPAADPATARGGVPSPRPPTPLFTYHFLCQHAPALRAALATITGAPHHRLKDWPAEVRLAEAAEIDADVLLAILRAPHEWAPAHGFALAERLGGRSPVRVWQRLPEETFDTPENRFVLAALRDLAMAAAVLPSQPWWRHVPSERRVIVRETSALLGRTIALPLFAEVGPMQRFPAASRVLMHREGYRDLLALWQAFRQVRRPLFARLQEAIDLRDVAHLYELWVFFALVEEIAVALGETPLVSARGSEASGLDWLADARFGAAGRLIDNRPTRSYSHLTMRPDFTWVPTHGAEVAFDAKFRLTRADVDPESGLLPDAGPKHDDLYRMHAYRDALGVRAAVAIYPGDVSIFYDHRLRCQEATVRDLLLEDWYGVGAIPMHSGVAASEEWGR